MSFTFFVISRSGGWFFAITQAIPFILHVPISPSDVDVLVNDLAQNTKIREPRTTTH